MTITALYATHGLLTGCASIGVADDHTPTSFSLLSANAGVGWGTEPKKGFIIKVNEFDGTNRELTWAPVATVNTVARRQLQGCLEEIRRTLPYANAEMRTKPQYIRSAVDRCIESAAMPIHSEVELADATDYMVSVIAGNADEHVARTGGTRIAASGGSVLGASSRISRADVNRAVVAGDVKSCAAIATSKGVFESASATTGSEWQTTYSRTTIKPMMTRFETCLRGLGYAVSSESE